MPNTHRQRRRDETVLSRRRQRCEHNSQLAHDDCRCRRIRSAILKLTKQTPWRLITPISIDIYNFFNNDVIMSSLLKKLSIPIKTHLVKRYGVCLVSFQIVDRIRRQSSWASCELCSHRRRRHDKTVSSRRRRRCVLGIRQAEGPKGLRTRPVCVPCGQARREPQRGPGKRFRVQLHPVTGHLVWDRLRDEGLDVAYHLFPAPLK